MSLLLGWGEHTFGKFCEGYIPTRMYSDEMKRLLDEDYFQKVLEENKSAIPKKAYREARQALQMQSVEYIKDETDISVNNAPVMSVDKKTLFLAA